MAPMSERLARVSALTPGLASVGRKMNVTSRASLIGVRVARCKYDWSGTHPTLALLMLHSKQLATGVAA